MAVAFRRPEQPRTVLIRFEKPLSNTEGLMVSLVKDKTVWLLPASFFGGRTYLIDNSQLTFENIVIQSSQIMFLGFSKDGILDPESLEVLVFHNSFFINYFDLGRVSAPAAESGAPENGAPNVSTPTVSTPTVSTGDRRGTVAVFTEAGADPVFLRLWEQYYGTFVDRSALYVLSDAPDSIPAGTLSRDVNVLTCPAGEPDPRRSTHAANTFQRFLLGLYKVVVHVQPDEVLLHPLGMRQFLHVLSRGSTPRIIRPRHAYDLVHNSAIEPEIDVSQPITLQRTHLVPSNFGRKPSVTTMAATWAVGFQHVLEQSNIFYEEALFMVHLGDMDSGLSLRSYALQAGVAGQPAKRAEQNLARLNRPDAITLPDWMKGQF
jgi:hypothetical protein